jgi:hypothetical protein
MIFMWLLLGTGTSLAWFTDRGEEQNNIFHFAEFDLVVEYRDKDGNYQDLEGASKVFDDEALYEPGYVQVVYLRIKNNGSVPFKFKTAVSVMDYTEAVNFFGQKFHLQDYLKFGIAVANSEEELDAVVRPRENATALANMPLSRYDSDYAVLAEQASVYMAMIVRTPRDVDNVANYRGTVIPRVELGLIVNASQLNAPD